MSDCDICMRGGGSDDYADEYEAREKTARKNHKCCECRRDIAKGQRYEHTAMLFDGEWQTYKTCLLCVEVRSVFYCSGDGWLFTALWEDMREYVFDQLTTASKCFVKLSPEAKSFVLERWRAWKGIAA